MAAPLGIVRIDAISINCPRPGCGGAIESINNSSFTLTDEDAPWLVPGAEPVCGTCLEPIRIPARARKLLGWTD